jgi:hypothetical protein
MSDVSEAAEKNRLQDGVFKPSRAEIAREMKCRLNLGMFDRRRQRRASKSGD